MQVKKFEAPTMFEALEMVKNQLGPDAIILNAKDNSNGFGLMGKKSIEITAAISERQLLKKQYAESRLKEAEKEKYKKHSARLQKEFIENSVEKYLRAQQEKQESLMQEKIEQERKRRGLTKMRYIDIDDNEASGEELPAPSAQGHTVDELLKELSRRGSETRNIKNSYAKTTQQAYQPSSQQRVKLAAENALKAFRESDHIVPQTIVERVQGNQAPSNFNEVQFLKNEILALKNIIQNSSNQRLEIQTHHGAEHGISAELSGVFQKLTQAGVQESYVLKLIGEAKKGLGEMASKPHLVEGWIAKQMLSEIKIADKSSTMPIQIFFGPAGSGKSSHLIKLASYYVIQKNKRVGILSCDHEKVGAIEQLRIYSQILNVPFGILHKPDDWSTVQNSLNNFDYILIDCAGSPLKTNDQIERFKRLLPPTNINCSRHLVLSATIKDSDANELADRYSIAHPTDVVFNKLDEAITHGTIYNFQKKYNLPLFSFGIGPQLPEDFEFATRERLIDLIFKISKLKG